MARRFSSEELMWVRNKVPVERVIKVLRATEWKLVEGKERFLCPECNEFDTGINPQENLGRCFRCEKNFNPVDFLVYGLRLSFVAAVKQLLTLRAAAAQPRTQSVTKTQGISRGDY
jgi:hypothetical protein